MIYGRLLDFTSSQGSFLAKLVCFPGSRDPENGAEAKISWLNLIALAASFSLSLLGGRKGLDREPQ